METPNHGTPDAELEPLDEDERLRRVAELEQGDPRLQIKSDDEPE